METNTTSIWNKNANDLTVGETLKISAVVTIGSMVVAAGVIGALAGVEKFASWNQSRKAKKTTTPVTE